MLGVEAIVIKMLTSYTRIILKNEVKHDRMRLNVVEYNCVEKGADAI